MPITFNLKTQDIVDWLVPPQEDIEKRCIKALRRAMYDAVNYAKGLNTYKDRTSHLRSSVLFRTYKDGVLVDEFCSGTAEGISNGRELADKKASGSQTKILSVCVAGMNYASYVEGKGFDVLTGAELRVEKIAKEYLDDALKDTGVKVEIKNY